MDRKYKTGRILLLTFQFVLLMLGTVSTVMQLITASANLATSGQNIISTIITFVVYVALINYAIWGYKKKYVPFRIAVSLYLILDTTVLIRLLDIANSGKESTYISATCFFVAIIMGLIIAFDNTFKDHKSAATKIGAIVVVMELLMAVASVFILRDRGFDNINDIMAYQPFARFIISTILYVSFIIRTHWRNHDKMIKGEK